jgi:hypothetical protein
MSEESKLPVAYQVLEADRLIDEVLAKLNTTTPCGLMAPWVTDRRHPKASSQWTNCRPCTNIMQLMAQVCGD